MADVWRARNAHRRKNPQDGGARDAAGARALGRVRRGGRRARGCQAQMAPRVYTNGAGRGASGQTQVRSSAPRSTRRPASRFRRSSAARTLRSATEKEKTAYGRKSSRFFVVRISPLLTRDREALRFVITHHHPMSPPWSDHIDIACVQPYGPCSSTAPVGATLVQRSNIDTSSNSHRASTCVV